MNPYYQKRVFVNTGKVRIGIATVPRQNIDMTADAVLIQRALLAKQARPLSPEFYITALGMVIGLVLFVMSQAGWLPGGGA